MNEYKCFVEVNIIANDKLEAIHMIEAMFDDCTLSSVRSVIACSDCLDVKFAPKDSER